MTRTRTWLRRAALATLIALAAPAPAQDGIRIEKPSQWRTLVSADQVEGQAQTEYRKLLQQAAAKKALAPDNHPQAIRLREISSRLITNASRFNGRAAQWQWEVNLLGNKQVNAFCMPGGKIAVYSGLIDKLKPTDDELAIVLGHEIAHALREHAREQIGKQSATALGANLLSVLASRSQYGDVYNAVISQGAQLLTLKYSRDDETEADLVGIDLAARSGFDPRAGVTLWEKMEDSSQRAPLEWLSTHPSGPNRIETIQQHLPEVMPLYERAVAQRR